MHAWSPAVFTTCPNHHHHHLSPALWWFLSSFLAASSPLPAVYFCTAAQGINPPPRSKTTVVSSCHITVQPPQFPTLLTKTPNLHVSFSSYLASSFSWSSSPEPEQGYLLTVCTLTPGPLHWPFPRMQHWFICGDLSLCPFCDR